MAKAFDDNERKLIKDKLKEGALLFIQQQGVRKTSVDELVKYANISKGAFYLFYTSKELLFFDTIIDYHKKLEKEFLNAINKHTDNITVDTLTDIISDLLINNKPYFVSVFVNSDVDSRHWGLVPDDFIVGVVQWIWYSKDEEQNSIRWNRIGRVD